MFYYIAASASASPQLVYLMDNANAQLVSLVIDLTSPANSTTLVYDFGPANVYLMDGMYYQANTNTMFLSCIDHFGGVMYDYVGMLDLSAAHPRLTVFYTSNLIGDLSAIAVSSTHLYYGCVTAQHGLIARIWSVPLPVPGTTTAIPNSTQPLLLYTTEDADLSTTTFGDLIDPAAFVLNANESILYITDIGNTDTQEAATPHAVYALWPLYSTTFPLNLTGLYEYEGEQTEVQQSFALSPDQSTLYWAATGSRNGFYVTSNANSSLPFTAPPTPPSSTGSSVTAPLVSSSMLPASSSASAAAASSMPAGWRLLPAGTVTTLTTFAFGRRSDEVFCMSTNANSTVAFAGSAGGDIFVWSITSPPATISPAYVETSLTPAFYTDCKANADGTFLYLLDTRNVLLRRWTVNTPSVAPVTISTFPNEVVDSLIAMAIDFSAGVAYIGTQSTDWIYAVNISMTGQTSLVANAFTVNSDVTALALSSDARTLYYASPSVSAAQGASVYSLTVQAGTITNSASPTLLYRNPAIFYPDSLIVSGSTVYLKDGGINHGYVPAAPPYSLGQIVQTAIGSAVGNAASTTLLYNSTIINMPPGMALSADQTRLYYVSQFAFNSLLLVPQYAPPLPSSSSPRPSSSSAASSTTARASSSASPTGSSPLSPTTASSGISSSAAVSSSVTSPAAGRPSSSSSSALSAVASSSTASTAGSVVGGQSSSSSSGQAGAAAPTGAGSSSSGLSGGAIAGAVVGAVVGACLLCMLLAVCVRRSAKGGWQAGYGDRNVSSDGDRRHRSTLVALENEDGVSVNGVEMQTVE